MIQVENLVREYKVYRKQPGLWGTAKSLFIKEVDIKRAVNDISFNIHDGEIVGYIGVNGAGKSTTIKMMTGILVPTSGTCIINGIVPYKERQRNSKQIGVVFGQRTQLWWDLPLIDSFLILKDIYNVSNAEYKERMQFLNDVLGLETFMNKPVRVLSLGQRMRADLGAALLHNPKILYLDEPTIGLDVFVKEKIRRFIKEINRKYKTTIILTTHDLNDIEELCNRIIVIDNGKKIYDGMIDDIKQLYGYKKYIQIFVKDVNCVKDINLNRSLNLSEDYIHLWEEDNIINIEFDKNKTSISQILPHIMDKIQVIDMNIKEIEIKSVIKNIYLNNC